MQLISLLFIIDFSLSLLSLAGGIFFIVKYHKEKFRKWWGVLMLIAGIVIAIEGVMAYYNSESFFHSQTIPFTMHLMLEWQVIALTVGFLCVIALSGEVSREKKVFFSIMLALSFILAGCYMYFSGELTPLYSWKEIFTKISHKDVQVKLFLFITSLISTSYMLYVPFYLRLSKRKGLRLTGWFWFYVFFAHLQPITYFFYALGSPASGVTLAIGCLVFIITFSLALLFNKNPMVERLSSYTEKEDKVATSIDYLTEKIRVNKYFLDKNMTVEKLAEKTGMFSRIIVTEYQKKGFESFSDFLNAFRLIYYKELKAMYSNVPSYLLISDSGFSSQEEFDAYIAKTKDTK